jgi:hypothetical protein
MKNIFTLIIVFLSINLYSIGKNHDLGSLNAVPGIPILHKETENKPAVAQNTVHDTSVLNMIINVSSDSIQNYLEYMQEYGDPYMLSKGHMSISFWLKQRLVASGSNTLVYDTFGLSQNMIHYCGTISIVKQSKRNIDDQNLLVAHQTPKIIYSPGKKSKEHFPKSSLLIPKYYRGFEWMGDLYSKTIANHTHFNTFFNLHVIISNSKPECVLKNNNTNFATEARKPEISAAENQGLEFILPQRI